MSPELTYYINKKHHIDGIPEPALSFDILKESVLNNIPRLQKELDKERAYKLLREDLGDFDIEFLKVSCRIVETIELIQEMLIVKIMWPRTNLIYCKMPQENYVF